MAIAGEVYELEIRIGPIHHGELIEGSELLPALIVRAFVEAGRRALQVNEVQLTVAGEIQELLTTAGDGREGRTLGDGLGGREARRDNVQLALASRVDWTEIALVKPAIGLYGQDAGQSFTVEIHPLILPAV